MKFDGINKEDNIWQVLVNGIFQAVSEVAEFSELSGSELNSSNTDP